MILGIWLSIALAAGPDKDKEPEQYQLKKISTDWSDCLEKGTLADCTKKFEKKIFKPKFSVDEKAVQERKRIGRCNMSLTWRISDKEGDEFIEVWRYSYCKDPVQLSERLQFRMDPVLSLPKLVSYRAYSNPTPEIGVLITSKAGTRVRFPEALTKERVPNGTYQVITENGVAGKIHIDKVFKVSLCEEQGRPRYMHQVYVELPFRIKVPDEETLKKNDGVFAFVVKEGLTMPTFNSEASTPPDVVARSANGYEVLRLVREKNQYADCSGADQETFLDLVSPKWRWALRCCGY